jgi:alpha-beta hydrolase superfamily lysophospholipase
VEDSLTEESLFYSVGIVGILHSFKVFLLFSNGLHSQNLYNNLTFMYPDAKVWITGHSLGGSLASLIGATFGAPVVAFEAVGEKMAARRLHLPTPVSFLTAWLSASTSFMFSNHRPTQTID